MRFLVQRLSTTDPAQSPPFEAGSFVFLAAQGARRSWKSGEQLCRLLGYHAVKPEKAMQDDESAPFHV
jgi:hypothetical protein